MRIREFTVRNHPGIGDCHLSFADQYGSIFNTVIIAGHNGCGKTAVLECIMKACAEDRSPPTGDVALVIDIDEQDAERIVSGARSDIFRGNPPNQITLLYDSEGSRKLSWHVRGSSVHQNFSYSLRVNEWHSVFRVFLARQVFHLKLRKGRR